MSNRWVTASAIIGLAASIFFSIISYWVEDFPVGWYFGILIFAITLLFVFFFFEFSQLVQSVRNLLGAPPERYASFAEILTHSRGQNGILYSMSLSQLEHFVSTQQKPHSLASIDAYVSVGPGEARTVQDQTLAALCAVFREVYLTPSALPFNVFQAPIDDGRDIVFLAGTNSFAFSDKWMLAPADVGHGAVSDLLSHNIVRRSIALSSLQHPPWLIAQCSEFGTFVEGQIRSLATGRIHSTSPAQIYSQQIVLSRGALSILALDMTEVEEWAYKKGLGQCLEENIKSGKRKGADIRRIFFCRSRAFMAQNHDYREAIATVIRSHLENKLGAGLIYQEDVEDPRLIRDTVIYDGKVVWVETVPTTRFSGEGFFSTDRSLIAEQREIIESLWAGQYTPNPATQARVFLERLNGTAKA